jgi:hypothetical protein
VLDGRKLHEYSGRAHFRCVLLERKRGLQSGRLCRDLGENTFAYYKRKRRRRKGKDYFLHWDHDHYYYVCLYYWDTLMSVNVSV